MPNKFDIAINMNTGFFSRLRSIMVDSADLKLSGNARHGHISAARKYNNNYYNHLKHNNNYYKYGRTEIHILGFIHIIEYTLDNI